MNKTLLEAACQKLSLKTDPVELAAMPFDAFLSRAIDWCGRTIADFSLMYDDFEHRWVATGITFREDAYGAFPHEALANLIVMHYEQFEERKTNADVEAG